MTDKDQTGSDHNRQHAFDGTGSLVPNKNGSTKGIELDEDRKSGSNGAWAPEGGQHLNAPEFNADGSPKAPTDEPTHAGRTQSTTNSQ